MARQGLNALGCIGKLFGRERGLFTYNLFRKLREESNTEVIKEDPLTNIAVSKKINSSYDIRKWVISLKSVAENKENIMNGVKPIRKKRKRSASQISKLPKFKYEPYTHYIILGSTLFNGSLLLGNKSFASSYKGISDYNIQLVINCTKEVPNYFESKIDYKKLNIIDCEEEDIYQYFDTCTEAIHKYLISGKSVLVHCQQGKSRSVSIIIAYLLKYTRLKLSNCLKYLVAKDVDMKVNEGFKRHLMQYEVETLKVSSINLSTPRSRGLRQRQQAQAHSNQKLMYHYFQPVILDSKEHTDIIECKDSYLPFNDSEFFNSKDIF